MWVNSIIFKSRKCLKLQCISQNNQNSCRTFFICNWQRKKSLIKIMEVQKNLFNHLMQCSARPSNFFPQPLLHFIIIIKKKNLKTDYFYGWTNILIVRSLAVEHWIQFCFRAIIFLMQKTQYIFNTSINLFE